MAIKLTSIYNDLNYDKSIYTDKNTKQLIVDVELLNNESSIVRKNVLYLSNTSALTENKIENIDNTNLLVIRDKDYDRERLLANNVNIIEINNKVSLKAVLSEIKKVFVNNYAVLDSSAILLDAIIKERNISEIAQISFDLMNNPVIIIDTTFKIMANSDIDKIKESYWVESINRGYCSYEFISSVKNLDAVVEAPNTNEGFIAICETSPIRKLVSKIMDGNDLLGYVIVLETYQSFDKSHYDIIKILSDVISKWLKKDNHYLKNENYLYENLIIEILDGHIKDERDLKARYQDKYASENIYLLGINLSQYKASKLTPNRLKNFLQSKLPINKSIVYEEYLLTVVEYEGDFYKDFKKDKEFVDFLKDENLHLVVSNKTNHILKLQDLYIDLIESLDLIEKTSRKEYFYNYNDLQFDNLLNVMNKKVDLSKYLDKKLVDLINYDKKHKTENLITLKAYLKNQQNIVKTAESLFFHRNTINNRIKQMSELFNINFEDGEELFSLNFSIKVLDYLESLDNQ